MILDFEITASALGAAKWEVFDARTAETVETGEAPDYATAERKARAYIMSRANPADMIEIDIRDGAFVAVLAGQAIPLPFTKDAHPETVRADVAARFPRRSVVLSLRLTRHVEYLAELAKAPTAFDAYWAGSAGASVLRDYRAGRVRTIRR
jgi:hypothetical protein